LSTTHDPSREDFLELLHRTRRGRLKLYLGYAPGVGKTFQMLQEALLLKKCGVDVVLGFIEPHGRQDLLDLAGGMETVPRKRVEFQGMVVEEMDLEGILARRPEVVLVDEVAHTNVPGSASRRRYQDILTLVGAGIHVICAFNIQHLESLHETVSRFLPTPVYETVPDTFVREADRIVTVDLAVEDLIQRVQEGKIYPPDRVGWALEHVFPPDRLSALRELVLREVAESLDRQERKKTPDSPLPFGGGPLKTRVMVCVTSGSPRSRILLHRGSRLAGRLNTHWFVVYVETPQEAPDTMPPERQDRLTETLTHARELGAEVVKLQAADPVPAILDFARSHGVSHIIVGRSDQPWWKQVLGFSPMFRLIREAAGFDVHIVSFDQEETGK
jgi:two-component system sensor histidine kinase KdpD